MSELKPFFSVVMPLYNKANYVKETIKTVLNQTFQDFEIVVIDDSSTDDSAKVVELIQDDRIRLVYQENAGVSAARNKGIQESRAEYIAFLDADDLWLPEFLQTIYELIQKYPDAGLYATSYKKRKANGKESNINIQALPSNEYIGLIPNYFKSIVEGDLLVWTSATCIPKKIFKENDIWFPVGEKYGEDQYMWARVAIQFDLAYDTKTCAIYQIEAENNTAGGVDQLKEPRSFIIDLKDDKNAKKDKMLNFWLNIYIQKEIRRVIRRNIKNGNKFHALMQLSRYQLRFIYYLEIMLKLIIPSFAANIATKYKNN